MYSGVSDVEVETDGDRSGGSDLGPGTLDLGGPFLLAFRGLLLLLLLLLLELDVGSCGEGDLGPGTSEVGLRLDLALALALALGGVVRNGLFLVSVDCGGPRTSGSGCFLGGVVSNGLFLVNVDCVGLA